MAKKSPNKVDTKPVGRPRNLVKDHASALSVEKGTFPGEKRRSYIVNEVLADKIDYIAYFDRLMIKEVVEKAFSEFVEKWEGVNGTASKPKS